MLFMEFVVYGPQDYLYQLEFEYCVLGPHININNIILLFQEIQYL